MIEIIDGVMPKAFNKALMLELCAYDGWGVGGAYKVDRDPEVDYGMMMNTYHYHNGPIGETEHLNTYARIALSCVIDSLPQIELINPIRVAFNRYGVGGRCAEHPDIDPQTTPELIKEGSKILSLLYHINDSDAINVIRGKDGDKKIKTVAGRAIIFDSNLYHYSTPPNSAPVRYTMNIIFNTKPF